MDKFVLLDDSPCVMTDSLTWTSSTEYRIYRATYGLSNKSFDQPSWTTIDKNQFYPASTASGVLDSDQARVLKLGIQGSIMLIRKISHTCQYMRDEGDMIPAREVSHRLFQV